MLNRLETEIFNIIKIPFMPACRRSLQQGNIFTGVHLSREVLPSMHHRSHDHGGLHPGGRGFAYREWVCRPPARTRKAGGTHPTGIIPCSFYLGIK